MSGRCSVGECFHPGRDYTHLDADGQVAVFSYCIVHAVGYPAGSDESDFPAQDKSETAETKDCCFFSQTFPPSRLLLGLRI